MKMWLVTSFIFMTSTMSLGWADSKQVSTVSTEPTPAIATDWPSPISDSEVYGVFLADLLEYNPSAKSGAIQWDLLGWRGGDYNRFWFKSEGLQSLDFNNGGIGDLQALYGRLITPFFDFQTGLAYERFWGTNHSASRFQGVIGIQGISPYSFDVEPILFISQSGDVSFRFTGTKEFLLTQRAVIQFRLETLAAVQKVPEFGIGTGFNELAIGVRLRYEFRREIAPYVGLTWNALFGDSSQFEQQAGPDLRGLAAVAGIRAWY